jgi:hypothetical protein
LEENWIRNPFSVKETLPVGICVEEKEELILISLVTVH